MLSKCLAMPGRGVHLQDELFAALLADGPPSATLRLLCCPKGLDTWLAERLPLSFSLHPKQYEAVLAVADLDGCWRRGFMPPDTLFRSSADDPHLPQRIPRCRAPAIACYCCFSKFRVYRQATVHPVVLSISSTINCGCVVCPPLYTSFAKRCKSRRPNWPTPTSLLI